MLLEFLQLLLQMLELSDKDTKVASTEVVTTLDESTGKGKQKRGEYVSYSSETRAKMGKYAAEHGLMEASCHFTKLLQVKVPEPTTSYYKTLHVCELKKVATIHYLQCSRGYCHSH